MDNRRLATERYNTSWRTSRTAGWCLSTGMVWRSREPFDDD